MSNSTNNKNKQYDSWLDAYGPFGSPDVNEVFYSEESEHAWGYGNHPKQESKKCTCGSWKTYGKDCIETMHSDWCELKIEEKK